jgi:hypothetical protein
MESVSFMDEFNGFFFHNIEDAFKPRMREVREITSPIVKRIRKWKDLEKFRNNIIAHPWRGRGKFVIPDRKFYNIPRNWFETGVLVNLLNYTWAIIAAEFAIELNESFSYVAKLKTDELPHPDYSDINADHIIMANEVHKVCIKYNKQYYLKVIQYQFDRSWMLFANGR